MRSLEVEIFKVGKQNINGHTYSREALEGMIERFNNASEGGVPHHGPVEPVPPFKADFNNMAFVVSNLRFEDDVVMASVTFTNNRFGTCIFNGVSSRGKRLFACGVGELDQETNEVSNYVLAGLAIEHLDRCGGELGCGMFACDNRFSVISQEDWERFRRDPGPANVLIPVVIEEDESEEDE